MTKDEILEGIRAICTPLPESRALRDRIIADLDQKLEAVEPIKCAYCGKPIHQEDDWWVALADLYMALKRHGLDIDPQ